MSIRLEMDDLALPLTSYLALLALFAWLLFVGLNWLFQPTIFENVGLAVYQPPPGTRLIPLPHKMDAPELVDLRDPEHSISEPASAHLVKSTAKDPVREIAKAKNKQSAGRRNRYKEPVLAYQQPWDNGSDRYRQWSGDYESLF